MIFKTGLKTILLSIAVALGTGCSPKVNSSHSSDMQITKDMNGIIRAQNQFGLQLFKLVLQSDPSQSNKLISPVSIYLDLSMAYNGAAGSTRDAMQQALQLNDSDTIHLNNVNRALLQNLPNEDPDVTLDIANAIWYRNSLSPVKEFLHTNKTFYKAKLQAADFGAPATKDAINDWVAEKTQEKIKSMVDQIAPSDIMFLLNAVYFKGQWTQSFDPKLTKERDFHTDQQVKEVPFMYQEAKFNYVDNDMGQIIELPYGNEKFSMYILLPKKGVNILKGLSSFDATSLENLLESMDSSKVKLYLPKWEAAYSIDDLKPELSQMGMGLAFGADANFSNMFKSHKTDISQVVHKTYIKVDEKGTEAAAATSIGIRMTAVRVDHTPVMDVNRPYFYAIIEKKSGDILFLGKVNDPSQVTE